MKKAIQLLVMASAVFTIQAKAQTGTLTGWGMAVCNQYSFSICPGEVITPNNYGSQNFVCTGRPHEDISFINQGPLWRVESRTWSFTPTLSGALVTGVDQNNNPVSITLLPNDLLQPAIYSPVANPQYVEFSVNNINTGILFDRNSYQISLTATLSASFSLSLSNGLLSGTSNVAGNSTWNIYSTPNGIGGPYTFVTSFNTPSFSLNVGPGCYYVTHTVNYSPCGTACEAMTVCNASCDEKPSGEKTGVNTDLPVLLQLFPNPASNQVTLEIPYTDDTEFQVRIYDMSGKLVTDMRKQAVAGATTQVMLDLGAYGAGTYLVKVSGNKLGEQHRTLIVE
ncbi:MAG: T9SS type A sorting domain-containing protein [Bacteroidia bacterium]|jgi:hypothetical protein|nr:T9SS type A sorting domain-containing protein [Bacteroidia bacterium]